MTAKLCIGVALFLLSFLAILLNLLIFVPVFRLAFVSRKSTIYIIAFFNIISDMLQLAFTCFHLSISIIADNYVFCGERSDERSIFFGFLFLTAWYMENLIQTVMAVNRFVVITLNQVKMFTFNTTLLIFSFLVPISLFSAACSQYIFPCCRFVGDHELMTYTFLTIEGEYSYTNLLLLCFNVSCTITLTICYIFVFNTIIKYNNEVDSGIQRNNQSHQDVKYLLQFVLISVFYVCAWSLFETLPYLVPTDQQEWYAIVPIMDILNCSSNSIIYLFVNQEVQKIVQISWLRRKLTKGEACTRVANVALVRTI